MYGAIDEFGFKSQGNGIKVVDLHAIRLHLVGLDHTGLTHI